MTIVSFFTWLALWLTVTSKHRERIRPRICNQRFSLTRLLRLEVSQLAQATLRNGLKVRLLQLVNYCAVLVMVSDFAQSVEPEQQ